MILRIWDVTLTVKDLKKAVEFYENVLGLQKKYEFKDYAGFDCGGVELGVKTWGELQPLREGEPCIDFLVDNIDEAYRTLREKGVKFIEEPKEMPWGCRVATFVDLDGNVLDLTQVHWGKYFKACAPK
ncbi:MAG: VOC family protein [candidate division Zixibacteria bacterium]|nr:VOC family protein [candidate division Zixibacteria bacterium]